MLTGLSQKFQHTVNPEVWRERDYGASALLAEKWLTLNANCHSWFHVNTLTHTLRVSFHTHAHSKQSEINGNCVVCYSFLTNAHLNRGCSWRLLKCKKYLCIVLLSKVKLYSAAVYVVVMATYLWFDWSVGCSPMLALCLQCKLPSWTTGHFKLYGCM